MPFARSRPMDRILGDPCVPMTQQAGGEAWLQGRWFFHYCLAMALGGR